MKSDKTDHYAVLGLDRKCTLEQIRTAYRLLTKQHHPDKNGNSALSTERMRELNEAYEVLGDSEKRLTYDRQQKTTNKTKRQHTHALPEIKQDVHLTIKELLQGTSLDIRVNDPANLDDPEAYTLDIPPETAPGIQFRIARDAGGFVRIKVRVKPDFRFKPTGSDLRCDLRIRAQRAAQGGAESLRGISGNMLRVNIPRGIARGEIIRIDGEGLPKPRGGRGDLLVRIIYTPEVQIRRKSWSR